MSDRSTATSHGIRIRYVAWPCLALVVSLGSAACSGTEENGADSSAANRPADDVSPTAAAIADRVDDRRRMLDHLRDSYRFDDDRVLAAMERVPRHRFVPEGYRSMAYADHPLPIGHDQTISQPYIVASMTAAARVGAGDRVLEIGTGSGYQAAVLAELGADVYTIEIVAPLGEQARELFDELGYDSIHTRIGDGYRGWPETAPFAAILVTAAPDHVPEPLRQQLAIGGRMVLPVGDWMQELIVITRTEDGFEQQRLMGVRFVPMTGEAQERER
jgi:protein-L-isoaspartate(D-aspartate) O-methyltransferase